MTACIDPSVVRGFMAGQYYNSSLFGDDEADFDFSDPRSYTESAYQPTTVGHNYSWTTSAYSYGQTPTTVAYSPSVFTSASAAVTSPASSLSSHASMQTALHQYHAALQQHTVGTPEHTRMSQAYLQAYTQYAAALGGASSGQSAHSVITNGTGDDESEHDEIEGQTPSSANTDSTPCTPVVTTDSDGKRHRYFPCPHPHCDARPKRKADLDRHVQCVHGRVPGSGANLHACPEPGCTRVGARGFTRRDHLVEHLRNYHQQESKYPKKTTAAGGGGGAGGSKGRARGGRGER